MKRKSLVLGAVCAVLLLAGCSAPPAPGPTVSQIPSATTTPTPTPTAEAGSRANPLKVGELRSLSEGSVWSVGADAATTRGKGYVVLPLHIAIDWDAATEQGLVADDGADVVGSVVVEFVAADGTSYDSMDNYDVTIKNDLIDLGVVYPPKKDLSVNVPISVPAAQVDGGSWRVTNYANTGAVWIGLG